MTFEFQIFASGQDRYAPNFGSRFFDAGCDDATVSFQNGEIVIDFARDAQSLDEAIASAIRCVRAAGARVQEIKILEHA
jgi:hypothetical protein